jgi:hypothetical protein
MLANRSHAVARRPVHDVLRRRPSPRIGTVRQTPMLICAHRMV